MLKTFENFDIAKTVINKFNKLDQMARLSSNRQIEKEFHKLEKFKLSYSGMIKQLSDDLIYQLEKELDVIFDKYPEIFQNS
jgi:hypothetical protein